MSSESVRAAFEAHLAEFYPTCLPVEWSRFGLPIVCDRSGARHALRQMWGVYQAATARCIAVLGDYKRGLPDTPAGHGAEALIDDLMDEMGGHDAE